MSYMQMAQLDVLNLVKGIQTEGDYIPCEGHSNGRGLY